MLSKEETKIKSIENVNGNESKSQHPDKWQKTAEVKHVFVRYQPPMPLANG